MVFFNHNKTFPNKYENLKKIHYSENHPLNLNRNFWHQCVRGTCPCHINVDLKVSKTTEITKRKAQVIKYGHTTNQAIPLTIRFIIRVFFSIRLFAFRNNFTIPRLESRGSLINYFFFNVPSAVYFNGTALTKRIYLKWQPHIVSHVGSVP